MGDEKAPEEGQQRSSSCGGPAGTGRWSNRHREPQDEHAPPGVQTAGTSHPALQTLNSLVQRSGLESAVFPLLSQPTLILCTHPLPTLILCTRCAGHRTTTLLSTPPPPMRPVQAQPRITTAGLCLDPARLWSPDVPPKNGAQTQVGHVSSWALDTQIPAPVRPMKGGGPPSLAWHLDVCGSFQPSLPHTSPPEGSAQGCLGAPLRGGGSRSHQRQTRPSEIRPQALETIV